MMQLNRSTIAVLVCAVLAWADPAFALLIAADDASQPAYDDPGGWTAGDNGGTGFLPWIFDNTGSGFERIADGGQVNIGTGAKGEAFALSSNSPGIGAAVRPFSTSVTPGLTFSIDMDNQGVNSGQAVGFSFRNASGGNLAEFYFVGNQNNSQSNYTVNAANVSGTTPAWTPHGLRLTFMLTDSNSFTMTMDLLQNGIGIDNTVTGDLLANVDQTITNFRIFNTSGGADVYFNNFSFVAIPEASSIAFGCLICSFVGISYGIRRFRRGKLPSSI